MIKKRMLGTITDIDSVVYLKCADDIIMKRLTGRRMTRDGKIYNVYFDPPPSGFVVYQRNDDNKKTIRERLNFFYNTFSPLMEYYKKKGIFHEIKGEDEREKVLENVLAVLEK